MSDKQFFVTYTGTIGTLALLAAVSIGFADPEGYTTKQILIGGWPFAYGFSALAVGWAIPMRHIIND